MKCVAYWETVWIVPWTFHSPPEYEVAALPKIAHVSKYGGLYANQEFMYFPKMPVRYPARSR